MDSEGIITMNSLFFVSNTLSIIIEILHLISFLLIWKQVINQIIVFCIIILINPKITDQIIATKYGAMIDKIAKRQIPKIKVAAKARVKAAKERARTDA